MSKALNPKPEKPLTFIESVLLARLASRGLSRASDLAIEIDGEPFDQHLDAAERILADMRRNGMADDEITAAQANVALQQLFADFKDRLVKFRRDHDSLFKE